MSQKARDSNSIDDRVVILNSELAESPTIYRIAAKTKTMLTLKSEESGQVIKVHVSRISRNLSRKEPMSEAKITDSQKQQSPKKVTTKVTPHKEPKAKAQKKRMPLDMAALMATAGNGAERWAKAMDKDKHSDGMSHCIIKGDRKSCVYFATYYNSLGPKRSKGDEVITFDNVSKYIIPVESYEDLISELQTKGYSRI